MNSVTGQLSAMLWTITNRLSLIDVIDIALLAFLIYTLVMSTRQTRVSQIIKGVVVMLVAWWFSDVVGMRTIHALLGWIELKTPLEEGWRAARRCKEMGKKLYLLSNYPQTGYERLRVKFADHFADLFDGGFISCYEHRMKPDAFVYETLAERGGFAPERAVFIDDTLKNVEGAMKIGMHGFHMHETGMMDRFFL